MIKIEGEKLNPLEKKLFEQTQPLIINEPKISITELSSALDVSASKLSKFVRKLGFSSFKAYKLYIAHGEYHCVKPKNETETVGEISRLIDYLNNFDPEMVDNFWKKIKESNKLVIYGFGPSLLCAEYFAYRLRIASNIFVIATSDEAVIRHSDSPDTKLLILSATGLFKSFEKDIEGLKYQEIIFLFEEFRAFPEFTQHAIFYLTESLGDFTKKPFEKSRTLFFIFLEEVIQRFLLNQK